MHQRTVPLPEPLDCTLHSILRGTRIAHVCLNSQHAVFAARYSCDYLFKLVCAPADEGDRCARAHIELCAYGAETTAGACDENDLACVRLCCECQRGVDRGIYAMAEVVLD